MKRRQAAIGLSLVIHGAFLLMLFGATSLLSVTKPPILLTFDLARPDEDLPAAGALKPEMETPKKSVRSAPPKPSKTEQTTRRDADPLPPDAPNPIQTAPSTPLQPLPDSAAPIETVHHEPPAASESITTESGPPGQAGSLSGDRDQHEGTASSGSARYLKEHFEYIRTRVLGNIDYPERARRMNWEGTVLVSFVVTAHGRAENIEILQGSGFPILDRNAVEAIRRSVPFPRPPVPARIVLPILYGLK
jgi:protein TonB